MNKLAYLLLGALLTACRAEAPQQSRRASQPTIIDSLLAAYGYAGDSLHIGFVFRDRSYHAQLYPQGRSYTSTYSDSLGQHTRSLAGAYTEQLNGHQVSLSPEDSAAHAASLNSVLYFALLPLPLADPAVQYTELQPQRIRGRQYRVLSLHFSPEQGGEDYSDKFLYWLDPTDLSIDYLAYSYLEDQGGTRFREAINQRRINGILFQDYLNYKGPAQPDSLPHIATLYQAGHLPLLSTIASSNIRVDRP